MMSQAQLLQCPDCGHRHDLATLGDVHTFRCDKCGRTLKVPAQYRNGADGGDRAPTPAQATAPATARSADATVRQPVVSQIPEPAPQPRAAAAAVPSSGRCARAQRRERVAARPCEGARADLLAPADLDLARSRSACWWCSS